MSSFGHSLAASFAQSGPHNPDAGVGVLTLTTKAFAPLTTKAGVFLEKKAA